MDQVVEESLGRILITGFKPFANFQTNPSEKFVEYYKGTAIDKFIFPVSYQEVDKELKTLNLSSYKYIFLFGLASERNHISFERVALNWIESSLSDSTGQKPMPSRIQGALPNAIINLAPLEKWIEELKLFNLDIRISHTAGAYLCNYLYFKVINQNPNTLFVHLPMENDFQKLSIMFEKLILMT